MPTLLVTDKMSPALAARVEQAVTGRHSREGRRGPGLRSLLRLGVALGAVGLATFLWTSYQGSRQEVESERARLSQVYELQRGLYPAESRLPQIDAALESAAHQQAQPEQSDDDSGRGYLWHLQHQELIFVRGPRAAFLRPRGAAMPEPERDFFLPCLLQPPDSIGESDLMRALTRVEESTPASRVSSLRQLRQAERFLGSGWDKELLAATKMAQLRRLSSRLGSARLPVAARAARSSYLIYLIDEEAEPGATVDFDGTARHHVRLGMLELSSGRTVLRMRLLVDPSSLSEKRRVYFSRALTSCALARQVRERLLAVGDAEGAPAMGQSVSDESSPQAVRE